MENIGKKKEFADFWTENLEKDKKQEKKPYHKSDTFSSSSSIREILIDDDPLKKEENFEIMNKEMKINSKEKSSEMAEFWNDYAAFSQRFSEISPIPSSGKKNKGLNLIERNNSLPMKDLNFDSWKDNQNLGGNSQSIEKHSILLIDNYEPGTIQHDSIFDLNVSETLEDEAPKKQIVHDYGAPEQFLFSTQKVHQSSWKSRKNPHKNETKQIFNETNFEFNDQRNGQNMSYEIKMKYPLTFGSGVKDYNSKRDNRNQNIIMINGKLKRPKENHLEDSNTNQHKSEYLERKSIENKPSLAEKIKNCRSREWVFQFLRKFRK